MVSVVAVLVLAVVVAGYGSITLDPAKLDPIEFTACNAGATVNLSLNLLNNSKIPKGDYLKVVLPSQFPAQVFPAGTACLINNVSHLCIIENSYTVSITAASDIRSGRRLLLIIPNVATPSSPGGTGYFQIYSMRNVGGQIIDRNEVLGTFGFAPAFKSATATLSVATGSTLKTGASSTYIAALTLSTAIEQYTTFRVILPAEFKVGSPLVCTALPTGATPAVAGSFSCTANTSENAIYVVGLAQSVSAAAVVTFSFGPVTNPGAVQSAGASSFYVDSVRTGSKVVIDRATVNSPTIIANDIKATLRPYSAAGRWTKNNILLTTLEITLTNPVPAGGLITITYGANVSLQPGEACFALKGLTATTFGSNPCQATNGNPVVTLSNFASLPAGSQMSVVTRLALGSTDLPAVLITSSSAAVIDQSSQAAVVLLAKESFTQSASLLSFPTSTPANGKGNIKLTLTPTVVLPPASTVTLVMPSGFALNGSLECEQTIGVSSQLSTCSLTGSTVLITTKDTVNSSIDFILRSTNSGVGFTFPALGSVPSVPQEWCIDLKAPASADFDNSGCLRREILPASFVSLTATPVSTSPACYTPVTFSIKLDVELPNTSNTAQIQLSFPTTDLTDTFEWFSSDLGTGLTSGSIDFTYGASLAPRNSSIPMTLKLVAGNLPSAPNSPAVLTLTGFNTLAAGTTISLDIVLKNPDPTISAPITLTASYRDSYGFLIISQTGSITYTTATPTPGLFTTKTLTPRSEKSVSAGTVIAGTLQLSGAGNSAATAQLMLLFPGGWSLKGTLQGNVGTTTATVLKMYVNSYAPIVLLSLATAPIVGSSAPAATSFSLSGLTNPYCDSLGVGALTAAVLDTVNHVYIDYAPLAPTLDASVAALLTFNVTSTSFSRLGWDVTYTFVLQANNTYPLGSTISVIFPVGFDLTKANCDFSMNILDISAASRALCTVDTASLTATLSQFAAVAKGTVFSINVRVVKNIDAATTPPFQAKVSSGACILEQKLTGPVLNMTALAVPVNASAPAISFFPATAGALADFSITFTLQTSVPNDGLLQITFPAEISLPVLTPTNCILNYQYRSCSQASNILTIQPIVRYSAGSKMTLEIPRMTVPPVSVAASKFKIAITWLGLTVCTTPASFNFTFAPSPASTSQIAATLSVSPLTAAELATYQFTLTADSALNSTSKLLLWFPPDYPGLLGNVRCHSTAASNNDTLEVTCINPSDRGYLVVRGFGALPAKTPFNVTVSRVLNPGNAGTVAGILVAILNPTDAIVDVKSTPLAPIITASPAYLWVKSISLSDSNIKALANYTFTFTASVAGTVGAQLWITLPEEFTNQALGFGDKYNCSGSLASAPTSSWISATGGCSNPSENLVVVSGLSATSAGETISLQVTNLKSASVPGSTNALFLSLYNPTTRSILARNYGPESGNDTLTLTTSKHQIIVDLDSEAIVITPGVALRLTLHTDSEKLPSRQVMSFVPLLLGNYNATELVITPNPISLGIGEISADFTLAASPSAREGNYLIKWTIIGDAMRLYTGIANSLIKVDPHHIFTINVPTIPTLYLGKTSVPLKIKLDVIPLVAFDISFTCSVSTVTPTVASFTPGSSLTTFSVYVTNTTEARTATMSVTLHASCCFALSRSILYFSMTDYDNTPPEIAAFIIANPRGHLYTDLTLQTTEACTFIYIHGDRGMSKPNNDSLALGMSDVATTVYIGNDFRYDFRIPNQSAESDYVIYGLMKDMNDNFMFDVFAIPYSTAGTSYPDLYDSVSFTLTFTAPPAAGAIEQVVMPALIRQLALTKSSQ